MRRKKEKDWDANLPDTSKWVPGKNSAETLSALFFKRCQHIEQKITLHAKLERETNVYNFDSGIAVEEIIREELRKLCPQRYSVRVGVINDRYGSTAGECDIVIVNDIWFPSIKEGTTEASRRFHFSIEGVYGVLEVKQALDYNSLDEAMEKLVICHRLYRPSTEKDRLIENRTFSECPHGTTNPLFSAIIATDLRPGVSMDSLVNRFFAISKTLKRKELVRGLCVLGKGTVLWGFNNDGREIKPALFMRDLDKPLVPVYVRTENGDSAFYHLIVHLFTHLYHSVLAAEDIVAVYGQMSPNIKIPADASVKLEPDGDQQRFCY